VNNGRLQFNGGFTQTNGLLALNGTAVGSVKPLLILGGTLAGSGDIFGSVFNADTMTPGWGGKIGTLRISGNSTQAVSATLQIELGGSNQFDGLAITGQASLNGKLAISLLNNFTPPEGSTFPILTVGTRTGQFSQITGTDLPGGLKLVPVYSAGGVSLLVSNTLPPLQLSIERLSETNAVKVIWPAGYDGYTLQTCTNLTAPDWSELLKTGPGYAIIPATASAQCFRLKKIPTHKATDVEELGWTAGWDAAVSGGSPTQEFGGAAAPCRAAAMIARRSAWIGCPACNPYYPLRYSLKPGSPAAMKVELSEGLHHEKSPVGSHENLPRAACRQRLSDGAVREREQLGARRAVHHMGNRLHKYPAGP